MARHAITNKSGKALCMAWRNGKRCRRVAKVVGTYRSNRQAMCHDCAEACNAHILQESDKGFTVEVSPFDRMHQRHYKEIA